MFAVFKRKWSKRRKRSGDASKTKDKDSERSSDWSSERGGKRGRLSESGKTTDKSNGGEVSSDKSIGGRDGGDVEQGKEKMDSVKESLERRVNELSKQLEEEKKNVRKEKLTVAKLQREVARNKSEGPIRESLMKDLDQERMLRTQAEQRVQEMTIETTACKSRLAALQDEFKKMEEMLRSMMQYKNKMDQLKQEKTNLSMAYEAAIQKYKTHISNLEEENLLLIKEIKSLGSASKCSEEQEKNKVLLERLKRLEAENSSLVLENEQQRQQYERCLDDVANQVVQALLAQKSLREECAKLKKRVSDLECQNRALNLMFQQRLRVASESVLQVGKDKKNRCCNVNEFKASSPEGSSRSLPVSIQSPLLIRSQQSHSHAHQPHAAVYHTSDSHPQYRPNYSSLSEDRSESLPSMCSHYSIHTTESNHQQKITPGPSQPCSPLWLQDQGSEVTPQHTPPSGVRDSKRVRNILNHSEPPLISSSPKPVRNKLNINPLRNSCLKSKHKKGEVYDKHGKHWGSKLRQLDLDYSNDEVCNYAVEVMETQDVPTKDQPPPIPPLPRRPQPQIKDSVEEDMKDNSVFSNYSLEVDLPNLSSSTVSLSDLLENGLDAVETPNDDSFSIEYLPVLSSNLKIVEVENDATSLLGENGNFDVAESPVYQSAGSELATSVVKNGEIHLCSEESLQRTLRPNSLNLKLSSNNEFDCKEEIEMTSRKGDRCDFQEIQCTLSDADVKNSVCERLQVEKNSHRFDQDKPTILSTKKEESMSSHLNKLDADKLSSSSVETSVSQQDNGSSPYEHTAKDEGYSTMSSDAQSEIERSNKDSKEFQTQSSGDISKNHLISRDTISEKLINLFTPQGFKAKKAPETLLVEKPAIVDPDEDTTVVPDAWSDSDSSIASAGSGRVKALRQMFEAKDRITHKQEEPARAKLKNKNWIPEIELRIVEDSDIDQEYIPPKREKSRPSPELKKLKIPKSASDSNLGLKGSVFCSRARPRPASFAGFHSKYFNLEGCTSALDIPLEKGVQFPLATPLRRIPCQILAANDPRFQQSSPNQRHYDPSNELYLEGSETDEEQSLTEDPENDSAIQGGARLKDWQPRTLMMGKNALPVYVQLDTSDSGDEFVLAFPSHNLGLCPEMEEQGNEDYNSEDSLADRVCCSKSHSLPGNDYNTQNNQIKKPLQRMIDNESSPDHLIEQTNDSPPKVAPRIKNRHIGGRRHKRASKDGINLQDPKARANLLDSMVPASSSGSESDPSEVERGINDVLVAKLANRRRRREVFHYIPVGRISIVNCREFFFRYGEREQEAIACFDFLDEIPLSCQSSSTEAAEIIKVKDSLPTAISTISNNDNQEIVEVNDSLSLSDSCAESYTSSLPCINPV